MNEDYELLYAAIRADPDNDLPRLAFADLCDANDKRTLASYIRTSVPMRYFTAPFFHAEFIKWYPGPWTPHSGVSAGRWNGYWSSANSRRLLIFHELPQVALASATLTFARGFVEEIESDWTLWPTLARSEIGLHPLQHVHIRGINNDSESQSSYHALRSRVYGERWPTVKRWTFERKK